jgi:hypothetical protein
MVKYALMTVVLIALLSMSNTLFGIRLQHCILRLIDTLGSWLMVLIDPLGLFIPVVGA